MLASHRASAGKGNGMCAKHSYASERAARRKLREIKRRRLKAHHQGKVERRAYRCEHCGAWHLTSHPVDDWPT